MAFKESYIPYGGYWSTPFCRWQGSFENQHAIRFAADITKRVLQEKEFNVKEFDQLILGITVPQLNNFYGTPWLAGMIGAEHITGPMIAQACATGAKTLSIAAQSVEVGLNKNILVVCADRCSNGPLLVYPNQQGPGGNLDKEAWVWDNFGHDPWAKNAMIETGENVAKEAGITREEQDKLTFLRYEQYSKALDDDKAFHRRFMPVPIEIMDRSGRKVVATVEGDEGIFPTTLEGLGKLKPVVPDGTVTYGTQTHPADGNTGIIVTTRDNARQLRKDDKVEIKITSFGEAKAKKGFMAMAVVPATKDALENAGISIADVKVIKTHNPFAVNDIYFCQQMDVGWEDMNNYGSSLIFGHPQGPTGARLIIEMIEELVMLGGGLGLFTGCAAGDSAAAVVIEVTVE